MAEDLHGHPGVDAVGEQERGRGMARVVQSGAAYLCLGRERLPRAMVTLVPDLLPILPACLAAYPRGLDQRVSLRSKATTVSELPT